MIDARYQVLHRPRERPSGYFGIAFAAAWGYWVGVSAPDYPTWWRLLLIPMGGVSYALGWLGGTRLYNWLKWKVIARGLGNPTAVIRAIAMTDRREFIAVSSVKTGDDECWVVYGRRSLRRRRPPAPVVADGPKCDRCGTPASRWVGMVEGDTCLCGGTMVDVGR